MKKILIFLMALAMHPANAQKSTLENLNDATRTVMGLLQLKKANKEDDAQKTEAQSQTFSNPNRLKICQEFCVENLHKKNAKISIEYRPTEERQQLIVMGKDRSCIFGIPFGIYTVRVYQDEKLIKKTEIKVEDTEQYLLTLPE